MQFEYDKHINKSLSSKRTPLYKTANQNSWGASQDQRGQFISESVRPLKYAPGKLIFLSSSNLVRKVSMIFHQAPTIAVGAVRLHEKLMPETSMALTTILLHSCLLPLTSESRLFHVFVVQKRGGLNCTSFPLHYMSSVFHHDHACTCLSQKSINLHTQFNEPMHKRSGSWAFVNI